MTRIPTIRISLACAYCASPIDFHQGAIELRARGGALLREGTFTTIECPHCDSKFTVDITTKRKSKGKRLRAIEQKREADHDAAVTAAITRNAKIAATLLAQPGCTCAVAQQLDSIRWHRYGYDAEGAQSKQRAEHGHLFGSTTVSYGIPVEPHHDQICKLRGTPDEAEARGLKHGGTHERKAG